MAENENQALQRGYDDLPAEADKLGLQKYFDGLALFIKNCPTPMTIAIQGGWGSGKTSAMRIIQKKLGMKTPDGQETQAEAEVSGKLVHIDFNTWQYARAAHGSLFIPLLHQLLRAIDQTAKDIGVEEEYYKKFPLEKTDSIFRKVPAVFMGGLSVFSDKIGPLLEFFSELVDGVQKDRPEDWARKDADQQSAGFTYIVEMKMLLQRKITYLIETGKISRLVFYIDDLDRLGPEEAVEFLEDLKNYIECEHCVFVLALDHEIVRRGLRKKYGNDIEDTYAQRFFDKIIQMPFSLPCNQYNIRQYVGGLLNSDPDCEAFAGIIRGFGDTNPRTIKRVFNIMHMYEGIENQPYQGHRLQLLAMLLLQTNHEVLYKNLVQAIRKDQDIDPAVHLKLLFGDPGALPKNTQKWFDTARDDRGDQAVVDQMAKVFFENENEAFTGYVLLFEIAGATSITGADLGGMPQAVEETLQLVQDYAELLGFQPSSEMCTHNEEARYRYQPQEVDGAGEILLWITIPGKEKSHINLNLKVPHELTATDPAAQKGFFEANFLRNEKFEIQTEKNSKGNKHRMDIIYNQTIEKLTYSCVLRNVSVTQSDSMRFAGHIMRNIVNYGWIFPKQTQNLPDPV